MKRKEEKWGNIPFLFSVVLSSRWGLFWTQHFYAEEGTQLFLISLLCFSIKMRSAF